MSKPSKSMIAFLLIVVIHLLTSFSCDPARGQTPYAISNQSNSDIVFAFYYIENTVDAKEYLIKSLQRDIKVFNTSGPYYKALKPNSTFTIKSYYTREELLEDASQSIIFIWIQEERNLKKLSNKDDLSFSDLDYFFLGTAEELRDMNWNIIYDEKNN